MVHMRVIFHHGHTGRSNWHEDVGFGSSSAYLPPPLPCDRPAFTPTPPHPRLPQRART